MCWRTWGSQLAIMRLLDVRQNSCSSGFILPVSKYTLSRAIRTLENYVSSPVISSIRSTRRRDRSRLRGYFARESGAAIKRDKRRDNAIS